MFTMYYNIIVIDILYQ